MKKFFLFIAPILVEVVIFIGIFIFLDKKFSKGALRVTSDPQSKVYLNGKIIGETKLCLCDLKNMLFPKDYTIKLVPKNNFLPFEEKISINKGTLTWVDRVFSENGKSNGSIVSLSPLKNKKDIEIFVISVPKESSVFLDNNPVGITPLLLKDMHKKIYDIKVKKEGYRDKSMQIRTTSGFRLTSIMYLEVNTVEKAAFPSDSLNVKKVLILDTPLGFLRVRVDNSIESSQIDQVSPGQTFEFLEEKNGWFKIKLKDNIEGWINSEYAKLI